MVRRGATAALLACALASSPLSAVAAEPSKTELAAARDLFARAERDEDAGRWGDALEKLRRAGTVKMTPGIRFHIALCEEKSGQLVSALADYTAAETAARTEGNKEVLDAVADSLAALKARVPTLTIRAPPDAKNVEVTLDGAPFASGLLGGPVPVEIGTHSIQARAAGRTPFATTVSVYEKQTVAVELRLAAAPSAAPAGVVSSPAESPETPEAPPSGGPGTRNRTTAIVAGAGAAALVGFGVAAYFVAGGKQSSAEAACLTMVSCSDLKGGVRTWDALALGSWIAGAGAAAVSVYFWTRPSSAPSAPDRGAPAPSASLRVGPGTVWVRGEF